MGFIFILLFSVVVAFAASSPAKGSTKAALRKKECLKDCGDLYKPVCAGAGDGKNKSFGSECVLANHNCEHDSSKLNLLHIVRRSHQLESIK